MRTGEGTSLEVNDGEASAYVAIADVIDISPPGQMATAIDRKRLSVTSLKERFSGIPDPGEMTFNYEWEYANWTRIAALFKVSKSYRITFPGYGRMAFTAELREHRPASVQGETIISVAATLMLTSLVAVSDATPPPPPPP